MKILMLFKQTACEVCGGRLRQVKSLKQPTTSVRFCSSACRHRRHRRTA